MGSSPWSSTEYDSYVKTTRGVDSKTFATSSYNTQEIFKSKRLNKELDPYNVKRECCDCNEHPNTFPVILALDVTGSMGQAAVKVAQKLGEIMTKLLMDSSIKKDVEFCIMGIGDITYDNAPIQMSQFEADVKIVESVDKIYFEGGGGGNNFESYSAAWYMGVYHCALDCWKRGEKGLIITLGDEHPNPYLPKKISNITGRAVQGDIRTPDLLEEAREKFSIYHISVDDTETSYEGYVPLIDDNWKALLGDEYYKVANLNNLDHVITSIIKKESGNTNQSSGPVFSNEDDFVTW